MANSFSLLDAAEAQTRANRSSASGSGRAVSMDVLSAGLFLLAAYALLMAQNLALFLLAFLGFALAYRPARVGPAQPG